jgi:hypothetical protein
MALTSTRWLAQAFAMLFLASIHPACDDAPDADTDADSDADWDDDFDVDP